MWTCFDSFRVFLYPFRPVRALEDAEAEASKMVGGLTTTELARLLQCQTDGRVNRVHAGELPSRSIPSKVGDDDVGTSTKRERAVAKDS